MSFINLNDPGSLVDFSAQLSENNKTISITPNVVLLPNTKFAVRITDLASKEGIVADTFEVVFTTIEALKVKEKTGSIVTLFPNPFSEKFHMNAEQDGIITVSDISGKNLAQFSLIAGLNTIDLSELSNGIYLIKSKTPKGNQVIKILKQ